MLRTALAVLVGAALLGVALPAADDARVAHADSQVRTELDHLETAAQALAAESDPAVPGAPGARIERTVVLPGQSWGNSGLARLSVPADRNGSVEWRVAGGRPKSLESTPPLVAPPDGMVIRDSGRHRLTLSLVWRNGEQVVVVSRADV